MTKYHKTNIYVVCEGLIETSGYFKEFRNVLVAQHWSCEKVREGKVIKRLHITKEIGIVKDINRIIAITTHRPTAEKKLSIFIQKFGFRKPFDHFIMQEPLILNYDTALVSVRRNYILGKTILFDFIHNKPFNARRYLTQLSTKPFKRRDT